MHTWAENDAMNNVDKAIKELRNALYDRGVPDHKIKMMKSDTKRCNFASAIHECIKCMQTDFADDKELAMLLCSSCTALLIYHDLRYERANESLRKSIAKGVVPAWYLDYKQQYVEHYRKRVNYCLLWSRVVEKIRFQIILKEDESFIKHMKSELVFYHTPAEELLEDNEDLHVHQTVIQQSPKSEIEDAPISVASEVKEEDDEDEHKNQPSDI